MIYKNTKKNRMIVNKNENLSPEKMRRVFKVLKY